MSSGGDQGPACPDCGTEWGRDHRPNCRKGAGPDGPPLPPANPSLMGTIGKGSKDRPPALRDPAPLADGEREPLPVGAYVAAALADANISCDSGEDVDRFLEQLNWRGYEVALKAETPEPRPCAMYFGSDGTLCSTHQGRFPAVGANVAMRCDRRVAARPSPAEPPAGDLTIESDGDDRHVLSNGVVIFGTREQAERCAAALRDPVPLAAEDREPPDGTLVSWLNTAIDLAELHGTEDVTVTAHMLRLVRSALKAETPEPGALDVDVLAEAMAAVDLDLAPDDLTANVSRDV